MYHHINPIGNFINVKPDVFEEHIKYLKKSKFTPINTEDLMLIKNGHMRIPERPIMITFDDGWLDNWVYAYPILKKYGLKAVIFVVTSLITEKGKRQRADSGTPACLPAHKECQKKIESGLASDVMLSWEEVREMEDSGIIDIQSHTHTHKRWDKLYKDREELTEVLIEELKMSKQIIEEKLNKQCNALCWPWGVYNEDYISAAKASGYKLVFTTEKGANSPETDPYRIKRIVIGNISAFNLKKKLFIHSRDWLSRLYLKIF